MDVVQNQLTRTDTSTYCPYKGDAGYYSVTTAAGTVEGVIWQYEQPYPAVAGIAGHGAFYPDKAEISVETTERFAGPNTCEVNWVSLYSRRDAISPSRVSKMKTAGL